MRVSMTEAQHQALYNHLYPGDGNEAVALALCGRQRTPACEERLLVHEVVPIPYEVCSVRTIDRVTWDTSLLVPLMSRALKEGWGLLKVHAHPTGHAEFSTFDDDSDRSIFNTVNCALDDRQSHASLIMLPEGDLIGREVTANLDFTPLERISVIGERLRFFGDIDDPVKIAAQDERTVQAFGEGTYRIMRKLTIGIVGASGTGALVIEQLARSGVADLVILDPKPVEKRNLNRIVYATMNDAERKRPKVEVLKEAIEGLELGARVKAIHGDLFDPEVARELAACDIVFGCMDTAEGRSLLNRLSTFYLIPYFDVGVSLEADGEGGISAINGGAHYLRPGGSSLLSRRVITSEHIRADSLYRNNPDDYHEQRKIGYVHGVNVDRPAVMPVNMVYAGMAVVDMLSRIHGFRYDDDAFAQQYFRLDEGLYTSRGDGKPCEALIRHVGRGDVSPMLERVW